MEMAVGIILVVAAVAMIFGIVRTVNANSVK